MTVKELARLAGWMLLAGERGTGAPVSGCEMGDLLSWVLAHGRPGNIWITVMGTVNAVAVAVATGAAAIVLAGGSPLDSEAGLRAEEHGIPVYSCVSNLYETALQVYEILSLS